MKWIRSHLSFANTISLIALFVALGGTSLAAVTLTKNSVGAKQIKKNAVRASEVKANAVGASELRSNSVATGDIADNGVGGSDLSDNSVGAGELSDNSVGAGELSDNSVGSGEVTNDSLTATDIVGSSLDSEVGPDVFARVDLNAARTLQVVPAGFPPQVKGIVQANVVPGEAGAATGTTCFDLPSRPASAMVVVDNADAGTNVDLIASVAIDRGEDLGDCPATHNDARVRILDTDLTAGGAEQDPGPANARFFVSFEL
jgi:hypothetical protein